MNNPKRAILEDLEITEVSVCDVGANGYSRILLRKRDIDAAIEAAILAHKKRLAKAVTRATSSADFDRRTAKSSAKCDREVAPLLAKLSENFECNPDPASLEADDGFAERDRRRRARDNSGQGVVPSGQDALSLRIGAGNTGDSEELSPCQQQYARMMGMVLLAKRNGETDAVAFARYIGTPEGRAGYDEYRTSHLSIVGKSFGLVAKRAPVPDDPEDPYDGSPEDALDEVEDEVKKLCAKGVTPGEAWDRAVAANPVRFAVAKRLRVVR